MNAKPGWLKGVFERAEVTRTYKFETGETVAAPKSTNLEKLARHCEEAFADVQVQRAVLDDARNHVVECEGEMILTLLLGILTGLVVVAIMHAKDWIDKDE